MNNILQAVSYDALFLLRRYGDERGDNFKQALDKSLLIKIRTTSNKLSKSDHGKNNYNTGDNLTNIIAATAVMANNNISKPFDSNFNFPDAYQTKIEEITSNLDSSEWFVYFINESSILARKVLKYYFDGSLDGSSYSMAMSVANNKLEYVKSFGLLNGYLTWYSDILESILKKALFLMSIRLRMMMAIQINI
ncbi:hypothetical protein ACSZMZ_06245 [Aeromonas veronii]|uniref:hypothetical protein n=2 Tax=Aeromonas veronii TaxID=654 RepID=UPI003B9F47D6